ncbi:separin [Cololabis saira]|uniref:separin n=1 Tax=Cololabis saira TaxID=129043 RepID=UPI002AD54730|nr:separin [Cololabis saira]
MKVDEYIKRIASVEGTRLLFQELEKYIKSQPGLQGRTVCDRVIRACNHQFEKGSLDFDHISQLVKLVELSLHGYEISAEFVPQTSPLYIEKIIFHIVKKLRSLEVPMLCTHVVGLLYNRLSTRQEAQDDYCRVVRGCFSVLWNESSDAEEKKILSHRDKLSYQMQALNFLLLLDMENASPSFSKTPVFTEDFMNEFESRCGVVTKEDALFLLQEMDTLFSRAFTHDKGSEQKNLKQDGEGSSFYVFSKMLPLTMKILCKSSHHNLASKFLKKIEGKVSGLVDYQPTALVLSKWGVNIHSDMQASKQSGQALTECARALRSLPDDLSSRDGHAVLYGCAFVVWAVESESNKVLSGPVLLSLFSFLEEYQERIMRMLNKVEGSRLQQALCLSICEGLVFSKESMLASQLENSDTLNRVVLYCQATAGVLMTELRKCANENLFIKAVVAVSHLACGLYNRGLYDQAFKLIEILCRDLGKNCPVSLPVDRLNRPFMLAVLTSRRAGELERALQWVILWLKALGDNITTHMAEPVTLWVKTKMDACNSEVLKLRTLRDGFGPDVPDERVMLCLLEEELRVYKELPKDTAQERYNTLCDLLEICHEESPLTHLRAVYLCEMAQVVCFQDFSEQTDCSAVDFTHEALRLLKEEPETPENTDRLQDDKAHALLWDYICSLEKKLQEAIECNRKRGELREQMLCVGNPPSNNDLDYEDKKKTCDYTLVYEGLKFNLATDNEFCQPLERALDVWSALFKSRALPSVRNTRQTCRSIAVAAALFRLMGKSLKALETYQLGIGFSRELADARSCASFLCQSASILLDMGSPELALAQLDEAEKVLTSDSADEGPSSLSTLVVLLKAQYFYSVGQIDYGVPYLCEVLKIVNEPKQSKTWYLLHARALQTCSAYLSLDTAQLPQSQRSLITQHGTSTPDAALYESLKLLQSLLVTLVGRGLCGNDDSNSDVHFVNQGDNLVLKWQLLSELLTCSMKMVAVRSSCGAVNDAKLQCLDALKLAVKLQALTQCAELLVIKAELELMQGESAKSRADLDAVKNLLECSSDFSDQVQRADVKIKPRKGRPARKPQSPLPTVEDDQKYILNTRWPDKVPVMENLSSSPPFKAVPNRWLPSLTHEAHCWCPCCSEPSLSHATARWAVTQADLVLQLDPSDTSTGFKLYGTTLSRCKSVTMRLKEELSKLFPPCGPAKGVSKPALMQDVMSRVYLSMALNRLDMRPNKGYSIWRILEAGLAFVDSTRAPAIRPVKAGLLATKAIASLMILAAKKGCSPEELCSNVWTWHPPEDDKEGKTEQKLAPPSSIVGKTKDLIKKPDTTDGKKETKKVKAVKPKIRVTSSSTKEKALGLRTPVQAKSKSLKDLKPFDFNTVVPTLACTPVQKVKCPSSVQKTSRTGTKLQFHVYEELSPVQDTPLPVPAAPKRTKKSLFMVEFSDESDSEAKTQAEVQVKAEVPKKLTSRRAGTRAKTAPDPAVDKMPVKRQAKGKKTTAVPRRISSEDDDYLICKPASTRSGRSRRLAPKLEESEEEPDIMRTIEEEAMEVLHISFEKLRTSDTEAEDDSASSKDNNVDLEVVRRDMRDLEQDELLELRSGGHLREDLQIDVAQADSRPDDVSLEDVQSLLRSAWLALQHFPCPVIYPTICALLASSMAQDPITTAMLHSQSLGVTSRHRTIRHLSNPLQRLKKKTNDIAEKMDSLSLNEVPQTVSTTSTEQRVSRMEDLFSFSTADPSSFPQSHCHEFTQQIQHLPPGVTVCLMTVLGVRPGQMGDSILLSRLGKDSAPVTLHISTSKQQHNVSWLVQEMDSILVEQKVVSCVAEKAKWWDGRHALNSRLEQLLKEMEGLLGCWKSLLLPLSSDPELSKQADHLWKALSARGVAVSEEMLKAVLSASSLLSEEDLRRFALGFSPQWDMECDHLLHKAMSKLSERDEPRTHVVLILDKYLQKLPWESMSFLKPCSVSRMPSLHSLLGLHVQREMDSQSILTRGVNAKKVFYVLDPDGNLTNARDRFKDWFCSQPDWEGVCGVAPDAGKLKEAVATKDLYIYVGHGAGAKFLNSQSVLKQQMKAASLLFGCSSAALVVRGSQEGEGILLNYLIAGCPFILGNLWDVTDRDIDRFTKALLESWFSAGSGAPLLEHMSSSREATNLKYLIGAAPVVYGLPIQLQ